MKQTVLAVVLFLATLAAALWLLGVFKTEAPRSDEVAAPIDGTQPVGPELSTEEPREEPKPETPEIPVPIRVLLLGETSRTMPQWLMQTWNVDPDISWQAWYGAPASTGPRMSSEGMPALDKMPVAPDLDPIQVLVVAGVDPTRLGADFWSHVAERVRSGRLGLLVLPEFSFVKAIGAEPSLASILPVTGVKAPAPATPGSREIAGVFTTERTFVVTDVGTHHPASRMVPYPGWSAKLWAATAKGAGSWTTKFCPVVEAASGAEVLVQLDAGATRIPAIVASGPTAGRVLWAGGLFDLTDPAYKDQPSVERFRALSLSWLLWLASPRS